MNRGELMTKPAKALYVLFLCALGGCLLTGCKGSAPKPPAVGFSSDFSGSFNSLGVSGRMSVGSGGLMSLRIDEPDTVSGLEFVYKDGCVSLREDEAACTADEAYLPSGSLPSMLRAAAGAIAEGSYKIQSEADEKVTYVLNNEFDLIADREGKYLNLKSSGGELEIDFRNFTPTQLQE